MDEQNLFETVLFNLGSGGVTIGNVILVILTLGILGFLYRFLSSTVFSKLIGAPISTEETSRIKKSIKYIFVTLSILAVVTQLGLDKVLFNNERLSLNISTLIWGTLILQVARFLDWVISKVIIHNVYLRRDTKKGRLDRTRNNSDKEAGKAVQWLVYIFAVLLILNGFNIDYTLFSFENSGQEFNFRVSNIFRAILIFFVARLVVWLLTQIILYGYYRQKNINIGSQFAINQLLKYVIYFIAAIYTLEALCIEMTLLWGGAAALLVGVGLGLQQTFNDFISGVILLFERTVEVGDVLEIEGVVGTIKKIGLRSSLIETYANVTVIVPNSKLVVDSVTNWSHFYALARFNIGVGVAYGTNTSLVKEVLLEAVQVNPHVLDYPSPFVRFNDFGDSALNFDVYFFSRDFPIIEDVKSDIRFEIDRLFAENGIKIPFPQREVWYADQSPTPQPPPQNL